MVQKLPRFNYLHIVSFFPYFEVKMQEGQNRTWPASSSRTKNNVYNIEIWSVKQSTWSWLCSTTKWDKVCWQSEVGCWEPLRFTGQLHVPYVQHSSTLAHASYYRGEPFQPFTLMDWRRARQRSFNTGSCVRNRKVVGVTVRVRHGDTHTAHRHTLPSNTQVIYFRTLLFMVTTSVLFSSIC